MRGEMRENLECRFALTDAPGLSPLALTSSATRLPVPTHGRCLTRMRPKRPRSRPAAEASSGAVPTMPRTGPTARGSTTPSPPGLETGLELRLGARTSRQLSPLARAGVSRTMTRRPRTVSRHPQRDPEPRNDESPALAGLSSFTLRKVFGSPSRARTCDNSINSRMLYQLSYRGTGRRSVLQHGAVLITSIGTGFANPKICAVSAPGKVRHPDGLQP